MRLRLRFHGKAQLGAHGPSKGYHVTTRALYYRGRGSTSLFHQFLLSALFAAWPALSLPDLPPYLFSQRQARVAAAASRVEASSSPVPSFSHPSEIPPLSALSIPSAFKSFYCLESHLTFLPTWRPPQKMTCRSSRAKLTAVSHSPARTLPFALSFHDACHSYRTQYNSNHITTFL